MACVGGAVDGAQAGEGAFDRLIAEAESSSPEKFEQLNTCIGTEPTRKEVFVQLRRGELSEWWQPDQP
jgi:hypothetical protein